MASSNCFLFAKVNCVWMASMSGVIRIETCVNSGVRMSVCRCVFLRVPFHVSLAYGYWEIHENYMCLRHTICWKLVCRVEIPHCYVLVTISTSANLWMPLLHWIVSIPPSLSSSPLRGPPLRMWSGNTRGVFMSLYKTCVDRHRRESCKWTSQHPMKKHPGLHGCLELWNSCDPTRSKHWCNDCSRLPRLCYACSRR